MNDPFLGGFSSMIAFAFMIFFISHGIANIICIGTPIKIIQSIIRLIVIRVTSDFTLGTGAYPCQQNRVADV